MIKLFKQKFIQGKKGISLVELMVAVGLISICTIIMGLVFSMAKVTLETANVRVRTQQQARQCLRTLIRELSESSLGRVDIGTLNEITFEIPVRAIGGANDGELLDNKERQIFGAREMPSTTPDGYEDYKIRYYLTSGLVDYNTLMRKVIDYSGVKVYDLDEMVIADNIKSLAFSISGETLSVQYETADRDHRNKEVSYQGTCGITLRN